MDTPTNTPLLPSRQEETVNIDSHDLQSAISTLHATLEYIPTLPIAISTFTAVDRALLDALNACVGTLAGRHFPSEDAKTEILERRVRSDERSPNDEGKREGLKNLEKLVMELMLSVNLLGSTWEVENGGVCVTDCVEESAEDGIEKEKEEEWVDVMKEDVAPDQHQEQPKENEKKRDEDKGTGIEQEAGTPEEKELLLPPLSAQSKHDLLETIATTTTQILTLTQTLHSNPVSSPESTSTNMIQVLDFYSSTRTFPLSHTMQQIRDAYPSGPEFLSFEILDADDRTRPFVDEQDWEARREPGMKLLLAVILTGLPAVGRGKCPFPGCSASGSGIVEECEQGGWICKECTTWFDHGLSPLVPEVEIVNSYRQDWKQGTALQPDSHIEDGPFVNFPAHDFPTVEDFGMFDFVKTYPLVALTEEGDGEGEDAKKQGQVYKCQRCFTHLALKEGIVSRNFRGIQGRAFLFDKLWNVTKGKKAERMMTTGRHLVVDVHCRQCREYVGWGYEQASELSESYKVGRFILEMEGVVEEMGTRVASGVRAREGNVTVPDLQHRLFGLLMKEEEKGEQSGSLARGGVSEK